MSRKKNVRTREARKRRKAIVKQKLYISSQVPTRTLKPSARKQLARERAPSLYIYPSDKKPFAYPGREYPQASLLGLPAELRQLILYKAFDMGELENMVKQQKKLNRQLTVPEVRANKELKESQEKVLNTNLTPTQRDFVTILGRRIRELRSLSPRSYQDMEYVKKLWQRRLENYIKLQFSGDIGAPTFAFPVADDRMLGTKGRVEKGEYPSKLGRRLHRCWYCTERHLGCDPICPMEREDPERWHGLTKKVGGWRARMKPRTIFKGTRIVFGDD
jgi:hypothetical protein